MIFRFFAFAAAAVPMIAAEIAAGGATTGALKPAIRVPEPVRQPASDDPQKQLARFVPLPGFKAELWAAEPMLGNPVAFDIDGKGRAFVAETFRYRTSVLDIRHYMFMLEDDMASRSTDDRIALTKRNFPKDWQQLEIETEEVRLVEDRDGDGKADFSSTYAGGMNTMLDGINSGVLALDDDVWCTNLPNLWRFSGTTADGKAEKRDSLSFGYGVRFSFTGHDMHGLAMGPDGRLYFSFGDRGAHVVTKEGKTLAFPDEGAVFRCEADGSNMEVFYRGLRNPQELAFDNHGNLFTGDNDCDQGDRERWVYLVEGGDSGWRVGWQHPPLGKVNNMWLTEKLWEPRGADTPAWVLSPIMNIPDGPSGVVYYPGTGLPAEFAGAFFVCGFKGSSAKSAISWWKVREEGAGFAVVQEPAMFLDHVQATDVTFGPDSKMYFTEWGEGWEGKGNGRIFKLTNAEVEKAQAAQIAEVKKLLGAGFKQRTSAELAKLLGHADQRVRLRAQWALAEKADAVEQFMAVAKSGAGLARLHAVWGIGHASRLGKGAAGSAFLALIGDADAEVRAQAANVLGERTMGGEAVVAEALIKALADSSARVRFFAAQSLARVGSEKAVEPVVALLAANGGADQFLRHALVNVFVACAKPETLGKLGAHTSPPVRLAALLALRRLGDAQVAQFLADAEPSIVKEAARAIVDAGIEPAMPALAKLIAKPVADNNLMLRVLDAAFRSGDAPGLAGFAADAAQPQALRIEAVTLLGMWAKPPARDRVTGLFRPLPARDAKAAVVTLARTLPLLLDPKAPAIVTGAIDAAVAIGVKDGGVALLELVSNVKAPAKLRGQALKALAALGDPKLGDAVRLAAGDADSGLRLSATAMLGAFDAEQAAQRLFAAFGGASLADRKQIITSLGGLKSKAADEALTSLIAEAKAGKIPAEAHLELIEAAAKHEAVQAALAAWIEAQSAADKLGRYNFALAGGDAEAGEKVFTEHAIAQCFRCHKVKGAGGEAGPDLTGFGARTDRRTILESIVDPNAKIAHGFDSVICTMTSGDIKAGVLKAETPVTLTLQPPMATPETLKKAEIKSREVAPSGMPPGFGDLLTKRELRDLVEFVAKL
ncbi:MAG: HEAT repeat domain-containing protein [Chthoniobacteraceae bacterium]